MGKFWCVCVQEETGFVRWKESIQLCVRERFACLLGPHLCCGKLSGAVRSLCSALLLCAGCTWGQGPVRDAEIRALCPPGWAATRALLGHGYFWEFVQTAKDCLEQELSSFLAGFKLSSRLLACQPTSLPVSLSSFVFVQASVGSSGLSTAAHRASE